MTKKENTLDMAAAVQVSDRVNLEAVRLIDCDCKQRPHRPEGQKVFDTDCTTRFEVYEKEKALAVFAHFVLRAFGEKEEHTDDKAFLAIDTTFCLIYSIADTHGLDDVAFGSFAAANGVYNAWPYWREFVHTVTSRMELPPLVIPVFRIAKPPERKAVEANEPSAQIKEAKSPKKLPGKSRKARRAKV